MYAPKQKGNVKAQLGYIGRYIRRPATAVSRITGYDGEYVEFTYRDKTDGETKKERIPVEEFIARLIRHIPDGNFKTIRYYGVYSRRIKGLCKKLVSEWQKEVRKWLVKAKRVMKRKSWSERVRKQTGKDPLICPKCENYYEYKGEVCLQDGELRIKYASCLRAQGTLERMIEDITGIKQTKDKEVKKQERKHQPKQAPARETDDQLCLFNVS